MPNSPIPTKPLSDKALFSQTCQLYSRSLLSTFPVCLLGLGLVVLFRMLPRLLPMVDPNTTTVIGMMGLFLLIPFIGVIWLIQLAYDRAEPIHYGALFSQAYLRLIPLFGALISMSFIPAIIIGLVFGAYLLLSLSASAIPHITDLLHHPLWLYGIKILIGLVLLSSVSAKLFAPLLVYTDQCDAETALNTSDALVQAQWLKNTLFHLYGILILILACELPRLLGIVFQWHSSPALNIGLAIVLLALLIPWTSAFWLVRLGALRR